MTLEWMMAKIMLVAFQGLANSMEKGTFTLPLPLLDQKRFAGCVRAAATACDNQNPTQLAMQMFLAGSLLGHDNYRRLFGKDQLHREQGRAGGKVNSVSMADMKRQVTEWDRQIKDYGGKKRLAMKRLGIPSSTYYKYLKACK